MNEWKIERERKWKCERKSANKNAWKRKIRCMTNISSVFECWGYPCNCLSNKKCIVKL
jgi:hypothetical protein